MTEAPILSVTGLSTHFGGRRRVLARRVPLVRAVDGVDLAIARGESFGIVGESGCGKTTLAKTIFGLLRETSGEIRLKGALVSGQAPQAARQARSAIQYVHQDPGAALDPWWRVGDTLHETLAIHGVDDRKERAHRLDEILETVGLGPEAMRRYPHELSGGQQRRIGLARILALRPEIVILDEPTSGLDLSVQANVLALLDDLRERFALTYMFISHDLSVVRRVCDRAAVMYLGRVAELGPVDRLFADPRHPYTQALFASAPSLTPRPMGGDILLGDPPSASRTPTGCAFHTRCPHATARCGTVRPELVKRLDGSLVACPVLNPEG